MKHGRRRVRLRPRPVLWLAVAALAMSTSPARAASQETRARPAQEPPAMQLLWPSDWKGGIEASAGVCGSNIGEYSYWVYSRGSTCGVPRAEADRVVSVRQPVPGMAPLTATSRLPGGRYAVWVYGAGQPGHPWVNLCAKTCVQGPLPETPDWVLIDWIETRDNQLLFFRTYLQPDGHRVDVMAVVLSSSDTKPDWVP